MDEGIPEFQRFSKAVAAAAKAVADAGKASAKAPPDPQAIQATCEKAAEALARVAGIEASATALRSDLSRRAATARADLERERALLAGAVAQALARDGLRVEGNLPLLRAGALSLEFTFGAKGQCAIWLGPRVARLANCPLEAAAIAARVVELDRALFRGEFDEAAFLADLWHAYRAALHRLGLADGERVPLTALLGHVAFARQKPAFLADPRRELFTPYGRVEFAADLSRLRTRTVEGRELRLDVATLAQTKRPEDHLWVPRGGDGVRYATASFARAPR